MKRHLFAALAVAVTMTAPALHAQSTTTQAAPGMQMHHERGPGHDKMMAELNLTDAQKAQIKAIHAKYEPQVRAERERMRPEMQAARAARANGDTAAASADRAKFRAAMGPMRKVHEQEMAEVRAILTAAQQAKFDTMKAKHMGMKGGRHANGAKAGFKA